MSGKQMYERVAGLLAGELALASNNDSAVGNAERQMVRAIALSMADIFAQDNERFDRERFYLAVGLTADGELKEI